MSSPRVETAGPPGQLIPDGMIRCHQWRVDGVSFELWASDEAGFVLANPLGSFEVAGIVHTSGDQLTIVWQGAITDRAQPWLNAQRAVAHANLAAAR